MIISDTKNLIFIHIYKTGGTSITNLLMPFITEDFKSKNPRTDGASWQSTWHFDRTQHSKFTDALPILQEAKLNLNEYIKFVFVRNPYSWILSIWNNFYQSPKRNLPDNLQNSLKFKLRGIFNKKLDSQYFYEMYPDGSFKSFVLFLDEIANNHTHLIPKVWGATDQYSFIENDYNINFDFIGRFENIQEDINQINNLINDQQPLEMACETPSTSNLDRRDYLNYYDEESIKIVNKLFCRDFQAFDYKPIRV